MTYFTDLAELVSRIDKPQSHFYLDNESEVADEDLVRLSPEDDEYMYDDDIILEEQSDDMYEDEEDEDEHFPESDKGLQARSEPVVSSTGTSEDEEAQPLSLTESAADPASLGAAVAAAAASPIAVVDKSAPTRLVQRRNKAKKTARPKSGTQAGKSLLHKH